PLYFGERNEARPFSTEAVASGATGIRGAPRRRTRTFAQWRRRRPRAETSMRRAPAELKYLPALRAWVRPRSVKRSPLLPVILILTVDVLGTTMILPFLPFYAEKLGASATQIGLLLSTHAACVMVAVPILGRWSDLIGRKPVLLFSQLGTLV